MRQVWVVVANGSQAKIYKAENSGKLLEIKSFEHDASRLPSHDLVSDGPGRATERFGSSPHAYPERVSPKVKEKEHFADEIAECLEKGHNEGEFNRLYIIAKPPFVAHLHHSIEESVGHTVALEVHKDLTHLGGTEIRDYLPAVL